jgi:hypothetical protein
LIGVKMTAWLDVGVSPDMDGGTIASIKKRIPIDLNPVLKSDWSTISGLGDDDIVTNEDT